VSDLAFARALHCAPLRPSGIRRITHGQIAWAKKAQVTTCTRPYRTPFDTQRMIGRGVGHCRYMDNPAILKNAGCLCYMADPWERLQPWDGGVYFERQGFSRDPVRSARLVTISLHGHLVKDNTTMCKCWVPRYRTDTRRS